MTWETNLDTFTDIAGSVAFDGATRILSIDTSTTANPDDPGEYAITITPVTPEGTSLPTMNVVLRINAACEGDYITIAPTAITDNAEYTLSFASKKIPTEWTINPPSCRVTYAATIATAITTPVTFDTFTTEVLVATQAVSETGYTGIHEIVITPSTPGGTAVTASALTFNLEIVIPCEPPAL